MANVRLADVTSLLGRGLSARLCAAVSVPRSIVWRSVFSWCTSAFVWSMRVMSAAPSKGGAVNVSVAVAVAVIVGAGGEEGGVDGALAAAPVVWPAVFGVCAMAFLLVCLLRCSIAGPSGDRRG
jgi:hypothetical protein